MTPAQRLQAIKDFEKRIDESGIRNILNEDSKAKIDAAIEALAPIISGELLVVPAEPTEKMIESASGGIYQDWPTKDVLFLALAASQEMEE